MKLDRSKSWVQLVKFNLVGLLNTVVDFVVFFLLTGLSIHYAYAQAIAYTAGMLNSYLFNSRFTFRSAERKATSLSQVIRFVLWNGLMLGLSVLLIYLSVALLHIGEGLGKIVVTIVMMLVNFYGSKRWVFADQRAEK